MRSIVEHREPVALVVVAGVVAERPFERMQVAAALRELDAVFAAAGEAPVGRGGIAPSSTISARAGTCSVEPMQLATSVGPPRSSPANWYSDSVSGTGVTAPSIVAGSAPSATAIGNGSPGCGARVLAEVERAAAMREPAHDHLVARDDLLPIDAEVLPRARTRHVLRAARDDEAPRDQRARVVGPAGLHRQRGEVDVATLDDVSLARRAAHDARRHVAQRLHHRDAAGPRP